MFDVVHSAGEVKRGSKEVALKRGSKDIYYQEKIETPEERERRLRNEKRAKERQERHASAMAYVNKNKLDSTVQSLVNKVLNNQPKDPYSALVKHLSEYSKDRPRFAQLRARPDGHGNIHLTVDAKIRGAVVQSHVAQLRKELADRLQGRPSADGGEEAPVDHAASLTACGRIQDALGKIFHNLEVTDFRKQQLALRTGVTALQETCGEEAVSLQGVIDELTGLLLDAEGKLADLSAHRAMKSYYLQQKFKVSPRMQIAEDFVNWQDQWPEFLFPVFQGKKNHRICLGITLWAATLPDLLPAEDGAESEFGTPQMVAPAKAPENPDADAEEGAAPPEHVDYCPPINSVDLLVQLGSAVVAGATAGGIEMPGNDDFGAAAKKLQAAISAKLPKYVEAEQRLLKIQASAEENMDEVFEPSLVEQQQHKCVYGVVFPDAQEVYAAETNRYDFNGDPENAMTADDVIAMYVELFVANPFLTVLCKPFSNKDHSRFENLTKLRLALPTYVVLIGDHGPLQLNRDGEIRSRPAGAISRDVSAAQLPTVAEVEQAELEVGEDGLPTFREQRPSSVRRPESSMSEGFDDYRTSWPEGSGFIRDCIGLHPLGIAAIYEQFSWAFSLKPGLYELSKQDFPCILPFVDVSLALPETKRMFLLPRLDAEGLHAVLDPVSQRLRGTMEQMYRNGLVESGEEMPKGITLAEWKSSLGKLGYDGVDEFGEALFHFLDRGNNNSISEREIEVLETVNGPAELKEVDNLRIFLVENLDKLAGSTADEVIVDSPIKLLWQKMDRNGSGSASFHEFRKVLEKLKFESDRKLQLFMCLDLKNNGVIDEGEWSLLGVLSSNFQLERVDRVRDFIIDTFGTMPKAYKAMDKNKSGALNIEEWTEVMSQEYEYAEEQDVRSTFSFLDKDCSNIISAKEFQFLANFNRHDFMREVRAFSEHLVNKYESIELAYEDFEMNGPRAKRQSANPPGTGESRRSDLVSFLEPRDFNEGYKRSGFQGSYDPRLIFNFLDAARNCHVSRTEFKLLDQLSAVEKLKESAEFMTSAIATFKAWAVENYPGDQDKDSWARTYAALLEAARGQD
jgi:Ca2+-binding EF-hand superfamily protein